MTEEQGKILKLVYDWVDIKGFNVNIITEDDLNKKIIFHMDDYMGHYIELKNQMYKLLDKHVEKLDIFLNTIYIYL